MMRRQAGLCLSLVALSLVSQGEAFSVGVAAPRALSHTSIALRSPIRPMYAPARRAPAALRMQADSEKGSPLDSIAKPALWAGFAAYMFIVFASDAPCGPGATGDLCGISLPTMMEAINLSINFWFVTPLVFPTMAPELHPALEGLFNIVIAWGALFSGFLSDSRKPAMLPFCIGTAFLTNVFLLPYLALRTPWPSTPVPREDITASDDVLKVAEGKLLPLSMTAVLGLSLLWAAVGRGGDYGGVAERATALWEMITHTDRLAHSFGVDCLTFWIVQGWLVPDDMRRRDGT
ncbi:hypothetical protein T484DRAFT_1929612 [Baffinella frigidus]|nr:hypothetical protein T484DRAFT_1929612 [Cryptophyta sp. CCMP2293]